MFFCGRYAQCSENKHTKKKQKKNESSSGALYATYRAIYIPYERENGWWSRYYLIFSSLCCCCCCSNRLYTTTRVVAHASNLIFPYSASSCPRCSCYKLQVQAGGSCITKKSDVCAICHHLSFLFSQLLHFKNWWPKSISFFSFLISIVRLQFLL